MCIITHLKYHHFVPFGNNHSIRVIVNLMENLKTAGPSLAADAMDHSMDHLHRLVIAGFAG